MDLDKDKYVPVEEYEKLQFLLERQKRRYNTEIQRLEDEIELLETKLAAANSNIYMLREGYSTET